MKFLFSVMGTFGDLQPFLALSSALQQRGHETLLLSNPSHAPLMQRLQQPFVPCGEPWDVQRILRDSSFFHPITGGLAAWREIYAPPIPSFFQSIRVLLRADPTRILVHHPWCFGSLFAAEEANSRRFTLCPYPIAWMAHDDLNSHGTDRLLRMFGVEHSAAPTRRPQESMADRYVSRALQRICKSLRIAMPARPFFAMFESAIANFGMWSPLFRPAMPDDPPHSQILGFPTQTLLSSALNFNAQESDDNEEMVQAFLQAEPAPLVCGLGTMFPHVVPEIYDLVAEACTQLQQRVILVGPLERSKAWDTRYVCSTPFAPYRAIFPKASAILHHGGIGTLAAAMASGKPSLILPCAYDQFNNAQRAQAMGNSLVIARSALSLDALKAAITQCSQDEALRQTAHDIGQRLHAEEDGAQKAVGSIFQTIEEVV